MSDIFAIGKGKEVVLISDKSIGFSTNNTSNNIFMCPSGTTYTNINTGSNNIGIGYNNFSQLSTGYNNISIGNMGIHAITLGHDNVGIGFQALNNNAIGNSNIAIGTLAGQNITTGSNNIIIGYNSYSANNPTGDGNIVIGSNAFNISTSGSNNVVIGNNAGNSSTGSFNSVFIGANAGINYNMFVFSSTGSATGSVGTLNVGHLAIGSDTNRIYSMALGYIVAKSPPRVIANNTATSILKINVGNLQTATLKTQMSVYVSNGTATQAAQQDIFITSVASNAGVITASTTGSPSAYSFALGTGTLTCANGLLNATNSTTLQLTANSSIGAAGSINVSMLVFNSSPDDITFQFV